jgi:hypothetical protein
VGKYTYTFAAGVLVIIQGLLTFVVPAEQIAWMRWRVGAIVVAVLAVIALAMQLRKQAQDEKRANEEQEKRERERDKKMDELLRRVPKQRRTQDAAYNQFRPAPPETLAERVERLAHEYYVCLQEGITRNTYESRLKPKLLELLPELTKAPFRVNISKADIESEHLYAGMRETADTLALTAAKMENPRMKVVGSYLVLDEDEG